jgi:hypothetical protein
MEFVTDRRQMTLIGKYDVMLESQQHKSGNGPAKATQDASFG